MFLFCSHGVKSRQRNLPLFSSSTVQQTRARPTRPVRSRGDGLRLARRPRRRWPPIKTVASSGHVGVSDIDLPEGGQFLPKPYNPIHLSGVLRELTGAA